MAARETGDHRAEKIGRDGRDGADGDGADFGSRHFLDLGARLADAPQNFSCLGQEGFAEVREPGEAREAVEKFGAEFILELAHLLRKRRLRDVLLLGRARKISRARHRAEVAQLMQLHALRPWPTHGLARAIAAMSFSYDCHSFHILDLGLAIFYPSLSGGPNHDG